MTSNEYLSRIVQSERLKTLKHWPYEEGDGSTCTGEKLAAAGFYCPDPCGDPETVRCFLCRKELDGWDPMDNPEEEHRSHSAKCEFVKMGLKDVKDMTMREYHTIYRLLMASYMEERREGILKQYDTQVQKYQEELQNQSCDDHHQEE